MVRTSVTFTGGGSKSRSKSAKARRASKRKKLGAKRSTINQAVRRALLNPTTSGLLGMELKFFDIIYYNASILRNDPLVGGFPASCYNEPSPEQNLTGITQGTGPSQRVGNKVTLKSVYCRGSVVFQGWTNTDIGGYITNVRNQHIFLALVLDKQANGTRPSVGSIYTKNGFLGDGFGPLRNMANTARFRVLKTWDFYRNEEGILQDSAGTSDAPEVSKKWEWSMNLKDLQINFVPTTTTGNIADLTDNALHLVAFYEDNGYITAPTLNYAMRFRFVG